MCVFLSLLKFYLLVCIMYHTEIKNSNGDTTSVKPESDAKKKTSVVQNESRVEPTILRFASSLPRIFRDCARICYRVRSWATRCVCVLACLLLVHMPPMDPMPSWVVTDREEHLGDNKGMVLKFHTSKLKFQRLFLN